MRGNYDKLCFKRFSQEGQALSDRDNRDNIYDGLINLRYLLNVLKQQKRVILIITMLSVTVSGIINFFLLPAQYQATTVLVVSQAAQSAEMQQNNMNTYVGQVKSDVLMQRVIDKLHLGEKPDLTDQAIIQKVFKSSQADYVHTPRDLSRQIRATYAKNSNLIEITVSNKNPRLAAEIANTLSNEFIVLITEMNKEIMNQSINFFQSQINVINEQINQSADESQRKMLADTLTILRDKAQLARSMDTGIGMVIVSPALDPVIPVGPKKVLNIAMAFLFGVIISVTLVVVRESLDNTMRTPEDVSRYLDLPVLGVIMHASRWARS